MNLAQVSTLRSGMRPAEGKRMVAMLADTVSDVAYCHGPGGPRMRVSRTGRTCLYKEDTDD
jgi:hypothetical protein